MTPVFVSRYSDSAAGFWVESALDNRGASFRSGWQDSQL